ALRTDVQFVQRPAKASRGRLSSGANQTGTFLPSIVSYSENDVMAPDAARFAQCLGGHSQACGSRSGSRKETQVTAGLRYSVRSAFANAKGASPARRRRSGLR